MGSKEVQETRTLEMQWVHKKGAQNGMTEKKGLARFGEESCADCGAILASSSHLSMSNTSSKDGRPI